MGENEKTGHEIAFAGFLYPKTAKKSLKKNKIEKE